MKNSVCLRDCYDTCFFKSKFENGRLSLFPRKDHPITSGFLCRKGNRMAEWALSGDRIRVPFVNTRKGSGFFKEISLPEALGLFKDKVSEVIKKYGPDKILVFEFAGNRGIISRFFPFRFFNKLNTSFVKYNLCDSGGAEALKDVYGTPVGLSPEDVRNSKMIVYWGINAVKTNLHGFNYFKKHNFKIALVDVRESETAKLSEYFIKVRPGGDIFLSLLLARIILDKGYFEDSFVRDNSLGFDQFVNYVKSLDLGVLVKGSGVSLGAASNFAKIFAENKAIVHIGYGFQRSLEGPLAVTFISYLPFLIGNLPGFIYDMSVGLDKEYVKGSNLRTEPAKYFFQSQIAEAIENEEVKLIFIYNSNPVATNPNVNRLKKALLKKDVFVVLHDLFFTDTAYYADLIFPAKSFFEHFDIADSYYHRYLGVNEKVFDGYGFSNYELAVLFAKTFGFTDPELYESEEDIARVLCNKRGIDFENLLKEGFVRIEDHFEINTPSKKVEFVSSRRKQRGVEDFPDITKFIENMENREDFRLLSVTYGDTISTQYSNIFRFSLDKNIYINSRDAERLGVSTGDRVRVYNIYGEIITTVAIDDSLPEGTALIYKPFWAEVVGYSVNELTSDKIIPEFGSQVTYHSTYVKIEKFIENSESK